MIPNSFMISLCLSVSLVAGPGLAEPFRILVTSRDAPLVPNSLLHLAQSEGYFTRAGVEVELIAVEQTPMAVTALRTGAAEMANISLETLLGLHAWGDHSLKAVGSADKSIPYIIAAREDVSAATLSQGGRFGVGRPNSLDHTLSMLVLGGLGVNAGDIAWVPLGQPAVRAAALVQGRIEATTISIGVYQSLPEKTGLKIMADVDTFYSAAPILSKINAVPAEVLANRSTDVIGVLTALTLAARDYANQPQLWAQHMQPLRPDVRPEDLKALARIYGGSWAVNGGLQAEEAAYAQTWLYQSDRFQGEPFVPPEVWADFTPADRMLAQIGVQDTGDTVSR